MLVNHAHVWTNEPYNVIDERVVAVLERTLAAMDAAPSLSLVSSVGGGGKYNFPHLTAMESLREGIEPTAQGGKDHSPDFELGIHYTFGTDDAGAPLGTIAVVMSPGGRKRELWRFGDASGRQVVLADARRFV